MGSPGLSRHGFSEYVLLIESPNLHPLPNLPKGRERRCVGLVLGVLVKPTIGIPTGRTYIVVAPSVVRPGTVYRVMVDVLEARQPVDTRASLLRDGVQISSAIATLQKGYPDTLLLQVPECYAPGRDVSEDVLAQCRSWRNTVNLMEMVAFSGFFCENNSSKYSLT